MKVYICVGLFLSLGIVLSSATTERENRITSQEYSELMLRINTMEQLLIKHFNITSLKVKKVDCREQCIQDDACTSVFWNSTSDSQCLIIKDKSTKINFRSGDLYYCKDCETSNALVTEGEDFGKIRLANVALNQPADASSHKSFNEPSMAVDGNLATHFSSEDQMNEEESWLMVDLGERRLVSQIVIQVKNKFENKNRGGYFEICLVDTFNKTVNSCNHKSRILNVNRRLRSSFEVFDVDNIIMGRFIVLKKLNPKNILEIVELYAYAVIPVMSHICESCKSMSNTVCNSSETTPECKCVENHFPINGDVLNGCKDPCTKFRGENAVCVPMDFKDRKCSCTNGPFYPIGGDPCNGCIDPCIKFKDRNTVCIPVSADLFECQCKKEHFPMFDDDICSGCLNPCHAFRERNAECSPLNSEDFDCRCKEGSAPMYDDNACFGCKKDCTAHAGYAFYENFGCLRAHDDKGTGGDWESARAKCREEGGDLFTPGHELPLLPEQLELNTDQNYGCWVGIRKNGSGPFKRIATVDKSELQKDSPLWYSGNPDYVEGRDCVCFGSQTKLLLNNYCTEHYKIICQIYDL